MPADKSAQRPATATGSVPSPGVPWGWPDPEPVGRRPAAVDRRIVADRAALLADSPPAPPYPSSSAAAASSSSSSKPVGLTMQPPRRKPPTAPQSGSTPSWRSSRRGSKASVHSNSSGATATTASGRRSSLPTLSLATSPAGSPSTTHPLRTPPAQSPFTNPWDDPPDADLYSSLQNFKFGAPSGYDADAEHPPAPALPGRRPSADRTPRPSLSGSVGGERRRGKMRALDRRPSVPAQRSPSGSSASEPELDLDTDVELDAPGYRARRRPGELSDTASVNTFGGPSFSVASGGGGGDEPGSPMTFAPRDEDAGDAAFVRYSEDDDDDDDEYWEPPRSASIVVNTGEDCYALPAPPPVRDRLGSVGTLRIPEGLRADSGSPLLGSLQSAVDVPPAVPEEPALMAEDPPMASPTSEASMDTLPSMTTDTLPSTSAYDGWDINYILGAGDGGNVAGSRRPSAYAPSILGSSGSSSGRRPSTQSFAFAGWGKDATATLRRGSAATSRSGGSDDVFMRHVRAHDDAYAAREREWTFAKEKAEGGRDLMRVGSAPGPIGDTRTRGSAPVGQQEIWRCEYVGRFKADRAVFRTDPAKPLQHRLNIRHIPDPYSKGNTRGGPSTIIHKHSRALAYSIFREHDLTAIRRSGSGMMSMNLGVLLAPKRVQLQYTQTKTTKALNDHGLLGSGSPGGDAESAHRRSASRSRKDKDKDKAARDRDRDKDKDAARRRSGKARAAAADDPATWHALPPLSPTAAAPSGSEWVTTTSGSSTHSLSSAASSSARASTSPEPASPWEVARVREEFARAPGPRPADDDEDGPPVQRTTHREAFATLDPTYFEQARARERGEQRSSFARLRRMFIGGSAGSSSSSVGGAGAGGAGGPPLASQYAPPWLTMAPRSYQEEQERAIANLNESFKDVGLLPAERKKPRGSGGDPRSSGSRGGGSGGEDVFGFVPDDGLFMLVPLWPKETEPAFKEEPAEYIPALERRQYLLVYYRKQEEAKKKKKDKERERPHTAPSGADAPPVSPGAAPDAHAPDDPSQLRAFHVCARLVGYDQLRTSGVRVPSFGLSVTGRLRDAAAAIPGPDVRARELDPVVIALWHGRGRGLALVPEPLEKLGLCEPRAPEDDPDEDVPLNVLGRAVLEMAWLGGMALTSFGPVLA